MLTSESSNPAAAHPAAATVSLLLADSRLPSGGHVSSSGIEPALMGGLDLKEIPAFLCARIRTVTAIDAATAAVTRHQLLSDSTDGADVLTRLERAWAARTPSRTQREVASALGRGMLRLAKALWPRNPLLAVHAALPRPLVLGIIAAEVQMSAEQLVRLVIYDDAASAAAALLKLEPGDPADATVLVLTACAEAEQDTVPQTAACTEPEQIPAASAPQLDHWIEHHATTSRRLFRA